MQEAEGVKTLGAKQVATRIGTDPKTFRKFLRSSASPVAAVGQGKRYDFPESELKRIAEAFKKWQNGGDKKKDRLEIDPKTAKASVAAPPKKPEIVEEDTIEELDDAPEELDDEPSQEDLAELEELSFEDEDKD